MQIKCSRCGWTWNFKGVSYWYALCPRCRKYNKIKKSNEKWFEHW